MRFVLALFSILIFVEAAQARISPPDTEECNNELTLPKFDITPLNESPEAQANKVEVQAQLERLFTRFISLGFRVPRELKVYLAEKDEHTMSWSVFTQGLDSLHLGAYSPMRAHQVAHLVLDHTLWHDPMVKVMADLRMRVDVLDRLDDDFIKEMSSLGKGEERYRTLEAERIRLESSYRNETEKVFGHKGYIGALFEVFVDLAAFADTGKTQIRSSTKEQVFEKYGQYGEDLANDMWRARDFAAAIQPDEWRETNYHRQAQIFFGPVRSYIGHCLMNAQQAERFAYLKIFYQAMREAMNEKIEVYGNQLDSWAGPVVEENKKLISLLQKFGGCY